jgi:hypothetical protein
MLVQRVLTPDSWLDSRTILGDGGPVEPIERYFGLPFAGCRMPDAGCRMPHA